MVKCPFTARYVRDRIRRIYLLIFPFYDTINDDPFFLVYAYSNRSQESEIVTTKSYFTNFLANILS